MPRPHPPQFRQRAVELAKPAVLTCRLAWNHPLPAVTSAAAWVSLTMFVNSTVAAASRSYLRLGVRPAPSCPFREHRRDEQAVRDHLVRFAALGRGGRLFAHAVSEPAGDTSCSGLCEIAGVLLHV